MERQYVCIFTGLENVHLTKDVGQIGNAFSEFSGVKSSIVCYGNSEYPSLKTEAKNQSIIKIKNTGFFLFFEKAVLIYLIRESKKIDFLHFHQLNKAEIYEILLYKFLNKKGKVIIKQDIHLSVLKEGVVYSKKKIFNYFHKFFAKKAHNKVDLVALDSNEILEAYKKEHPEATDKLVLLSNNLNDKYLSENFPIRRTFNEKENIILTTGRIGAEDKNYEMLLETIPLIELKDWKVVFVGEISNDFDKKVAQLLVDYPHLKGKIELTGQIEDRVELYKYYDRSKIFCLTSVLESFGVSYIEALYFGNYIFGTTGMSSFDYISNNEELGKKIIVNDRSELAGSINNIIQGNVNISDNVENAYEYIASNFFISNNIQVLNKVLE
jgi:GalNAc-alpha-(1->4)-GalNAc-alpha-(1->3)-diNAcBac-PP-undecaprenol alpha-1,4-N-acetyl-D-galactosaminyltransferase